MDIQSTTDAGGGYDVGWTAAGEWMNYTVDVATGGFYDITFRVAPGGGAAGGTFHLADAAGDNLTGELSIPATGGTQTFTNVAAERISLSAGTQILTIDMDTAGSGGYIGNFNYFTLATSAAPAAPTSVTAVGSNLGTITLAWTAPASPVDSYDVYRSTTPGGEGGTPIATGITATSYTDSTVSSRVTYYYTVTAIDQTGQSTASSEVSAQATRDGNPYGGTAPSVSLTGTTAIQSEDYNTGGQNIAYYDTGSAPETQTTTDTGGGSIVAFVYASEWLKYTINVTTTGAYSLDFRVASNGLGGTFHVEDELGNNLTGSLTVPNTNGWQTLTNLLTPSFNLSAGTHVLKVVMDTNGPGGNVGNFNYFAIGAGAAPGTVTNVAAHAVSETTVLLSWSASPGASDYLVQRSIDGGDFETIATVAAAALTAYEDSSLSAGQSAQYTVVPGNLSGSTGGDSSASVTTAAAGSDQLWEVSLSPGTHGSTAATDTDGDGGSASDALNVDTPIVEADSAVDAIALAVSGEIYTDTANAFQASGFFPFMLDQDAPSAAALAAEGVAFVVRNDQTANGVPYNPSTMDGLNYNAATGAYSGWIGLEDLTELGTSSSNDKDYNDWYWPVSVSQVSTQLTITDGSNAQNTVTATNSTPAGLYVEEDYSTGHAEIVLDGDVSPDDRGTRAQTLWQVTPAGSSNPSTGSLLPSEEISITLAPDSTNDFTVTLGIDLNGNGILDANEVQNTVTVHVVEFNTLTVFDPTATNNSVTATRGDGPVDLYVQQPESGPATIQMNPGYSPDEDGVLDHLVWSIAGSGASPASGVFHTGALGTQVQLTPGDYDFTLTAAFDSNGNGQMDETPEFTINAHVLKLNSLTVSNSYDATDTATAINADVQDLYLVANSQDQAEVDIAADFAPDAGGDHIGWEISGGPFPDSGTFSNGPQISDCLITGAPGDNDISITAWVDANNNGLIDPGEITREIDVHLVSAASITGTLGTQSQTSSDSALNITDANSFAVPQSVGDINLQLNGLSSTDPAVLGLVHWVVVPDSQNGASPNIATNPLSPLNADVNTDSVGTLNAIAYLDSNHNGQYDQGEELKVFHVAEVGITLSNVIATPAPPGGFSAAVVGNSAVFYSGSQASPAFKMTAHVLLQGGGANEMIGVSKIGVGFLQDGFSDSLSMAYVGGGKGNEGLKNGLTFPILDGAHAASGGYSPFQQQPPPPTPNPAGGESYDVSWWDAPEGIFDQTHAFNGGPASQATHLTGNNTFIVRLLAFSQDFNQTYISYYATKWTCTFDFTWNVATTNWDDTGSSAVLISSAASPQGGDPGVTSGPIFNDETTVVYQ